ncbi:sirohydrochlorin chelatase [Nocardiopsis chromatogenes]|uniref:sirohydrochlorin chelatase n=1 Tax=Nocardiopsis chromatogenes TaxID=280239 RepID=UPI0003480B0A|nr:CbiX/SirB N-terminal domain-containing protein [Nocardiopsis chromatogenes]
MVPTMVLVADDSNDAHRARSLHELADAVAGRGEAPVVPAFGARKEVQRELDAVTGPKVVVPAYVAGGCVDSAGLYASLDLGTGPDAGGGVCATAPLGAVPSIVADLAGRLAERGWEPGDGVVLAADGGESAEERQAVAEVARMLSRRLGAPVQVGFVTAWAPTVADAVERLRSADAGRVAVAAWRLVADADFDRLRALDAVVTPPLWPSDNVVDTLLAQHRAATARLAV